MKLYGEKNIEYMSAGELREELAKYPDDTMVQDFKGSAIIKGVRRYDPPDSDNSIGFLFLDNDN